MYAMKEKVINLIDKTKLFSEKQFNDKLLNLKIQHLEK